MQRPRNPCPGLRTARDRRTRSEQFLCRGAADARAGDSHEDRFEKAALLVEHEQRGATAAFRHMPGQHQQPRAARLPTIYGVRCFAEYWGARGCSRNIYVIWVTNSGHYKGGDQRTIDATAYSGHTQPTIAVLNATYQPMR